MSQPPGPRAFAPPTALLFSLFAAGLGRLHASSYGDALPAFTRLFLAWYPLWILIGGLASIAVVLPERLRSRFGGQAAWRMIDAALTLASTLVIALGVLALALPVFIGPRV